MRNKRRNMIDLPRTVEYQMEKSADVAVVSRDFSTLKAEMKWVKGLR